MSTYMQALKPLLMLKCVAGIKNARSEIEYQQISERL
jgi:hypothetical protein